MPKPRRRKRGRPKNRRAGCLMCKPWKMNGAKASTHDHVSKKRFRECVRDELRDAV